MARKLFEKQGVRGRAGALVTGSAFEVYADEAGTTLANISATVGGSAIAGSIVTVADIAGLGPAALRFYGPSDGTDTLWLKSVTDAALGLQKLEADPDPRLDALEAGSASGIPGTIFDAKGDIIAATAADTAARLPVGTNGQMLTAASGQSTGLQWATPAAFSASVTYVKDYVPAPDGTTDNTAALGSALVAAAGKVLEFEQGKTYVVNAPLAPAALTQIRGNHATLKPGSARTGLLSTHGTVFNIDSVYGVEIHNLWFAEPASAWGALNAEEGIVRIDDSADCKVRDCDFIDIDTRAVLVLGSSSVDNIITGNYLQSASIGYSYNGASRTVCSNNTIHGGSLGGTGNGGTPNADCIVEDNHIIDSGYMGIEDWGTTTGTVIRGNIIKNPANYGISAVGRNTLVEGNNIVDPTGYGIELPGEGNRCIGNSIRYVNVTLTSSSIGIISNTGGNSPYAGITIQGNYIEGSWQGIQLFSTNVVATISGNHLLNWRTVGINTQSTSGYSTVVANTLQLSSPSVTGDGSYRVGVVLGAASPSTVVGNSFVWYSTANGGVNQDIGVLPIGDYHVISANTFHGGGIVSPFVPAAVKATTGTPTGVRLLGNTFVGGAALDPALFVGLVTDRNTGPTAPADTPAVRSAVNRRASTSLTVNGTAWANADTGLDIVLAAVTGDKIEYGINLAWGSENVTAYMDACTVVSGSPVTYFSSGTGTQPADGLSGFTAPGNTFVQKDGSAMLVLAAGDISAGTVTLRLRVKTLSAVNRTLFAISDDPLMVYAKNLGPG